jgi:hypothetical protein
MGGGEGMDCILWFECATFDCYPFVTTSRAFCLLIVELKTNSAFVIKSRMGVYIYIYIYIYMCVCVCVCVCVCKYIKTEICPSNRPWRPIGL